MLRAFLAQFDNVYTTLYMHLCCWCLTRKSSPSVVIFDEYERIEVQIIAVILLIPSVLPVYRHSSAMGKLSRYYIPVY
jgi:hypothetical protein